MLSIKSPRRKTLETLRSKGPAPVRVKSLDNPEIQPLNETTAEFTSEETDSKRGVNFISVPPLADSDVTIVAISVYFKEVDSEATFNILLSSQITQLFTGTPYTGHVARDRYVYFTVNIMRSECTLLISLTNLEEGDADLVISYGQNTRPTIANHQFAYLSDQKTEVIEINNSDISPLESMAGSWVIGVYGDTASAFRLTVVYEERKIVDLKAEVPVEMSLEASSFVYFKYLHQFERNLQINFTKFSGELNIYITSIDLNQDFVANIPDQTHYKWQNPQGALAINMQDDKACVSCVYIMNIEAVSVSKFSLVVNELDNIRQIQSGLKYEGRLKPQRSIDYMLQHFNKNNQENQLNLEMKGSELIVLGYKNPLMNLTNYRWKETVTSNKIILIKDSPYISFYNPTQEALDFSFIVTPKLMTFERLEQVYELNPSEKMFFEYISTNKSPFIGETCDNNGENCRKQREAETVIDIVFYAVQKKGESKRGTMESYLTLSLRGEIF